MLWNLLAKMGGLGARLCGAVVTSGSAFCSGCGANLRVEHTCASCGAKQKDPAARFCNRCGKPLTS